MNFTERYGPWALIAGASEGTGRAFALSLAAQGLPSILLARRTTPLVTLAAEIRARSGIDCVTATVDLAATDALDHIVAAVGEREVGLFIANAGSDPHGAQFLDRDVGVWLELIHRNVVTTLQCCHHFARPMRARRRGGILLVNSGACYGGGSFMSAYAASKAFMLGLGEALWSELRPFGVDVLNLVLSRTDTPALRALLADKGLPVPTVLASPDAVAEVGLARLPHGPIHNWGQDDAVAGFAILSARQRRARILAVDAASQSIFGSRQST